MANKLSHFSHTLGEQVVSLDIHHSDQENRNGSIKRRWISCSKNPRASGPFRLMSISNAFNLLQIVLSSLDFLGNRLWNQPIDLFRFDPSHMR